MIPDHQHLTRMVRASACEVFSTMIGLDLEPCDAYIDTGSPQTVDGVHSFVGLAGSWVGTGSLSCTAAVACNVSSRFLQAQCSFIDEDVLDAVAEITNMIIGNVKTLLEEDLGPIGLTIPTVIFGKNFASRTVGKFQWTVVPFLFQGERIQIQICLAPQKESVRSRLQHGNVHEPAAR